MFQTFSEALCTNPLLLRACLAGLAASILSGTLGTFVVAKRLEGLSGSISHVILAGLGAALYCQRAQGWEFASPLFGALVTALGAAIAIGWVHHRYGESQGGVIAALWPLGMAVGYLFIAATPGSNLELTNYLFGNILWTTERDIALLLALDLVVVGTIALMFKQLKAFCFDQEWARLQSVKTERVYTLLLCLIAVGIVVMTYIVGTILVLTLLTAPPLIAARWAKGVLGMMVIATSLAALFCTWGLYASFALDLPTGALISLIAGVAHGLSLIFARRAGAGRG